MYAIIETGGKQYKVQEGDVITVELLHAEAGETVSIDKVLMVESRTESKKKRQSSKNRCLQIQSKEKLP